MDLGSSSYDWAIKPSLSFDSLDYSSSPVMSLTRFKVKPVMPDAPQELAHLVDSAIMGWAEGLEKLRSMVSNSGGGGLGMCSEEFLAVGRGVGKHHAEFAGEC
ncbi:hypothetical protein J5N97_009725 [Dioscorea zingiberensis]|uniref:Uncharacterized protein n=1 Tax=Dioscorea zingiberensis TaxID=325984 RepID=A0A9D5CX07_9LILI|nr:hypothetical protein J5N97_009725 [Dioscorea zingiberensis]